MVKLKWTPQKPEWSEESYKLLLDYDVKPPTMQTVKNIIKKSSKFPIKFQADTVRCKFLQNYVADDVLERNINSVYPFVHHKALELFCKFILYKRKYGSQIEQKFYKKIGLKEFIEKLLFKRAVSFYAAYDRYLLINNKKGTNNWDTIGKNGEKLPLVLKDCLSYDEIKCSVFLNVSSYTYFVNKGDRRNMAKFSEDRSNIADDGIIIGLVGPRLKKRNVMEFEEIVISEEQNTPDNGFGSSVNNSLHQLFAEFYEENCPEYREIIQLKESLPSSDERFLTINAYQFDNYIYYKRLAISFDSLLLEANMRAKSAKKSAYIHVVGLGLGVWRISDHQGEVFMETFADRIELLGRYLHAVSDICFSYITPLKCGEYHHGDLMPIADHPLGGIRIHMYKRDPHVKLCQEDEQKLLVVSYAWDGNALPGNEWWYGNLGSSGDSAAASSTQITELHNPHINSLVSADNLMVITDNDVVPLTKYQEMVKFNKSNEHEQEDSK